METQMKQQQRPWKNDGTKLLSKIGNVVRTFGEGQRVRRNDEIESAVREKKESLNMWKRKGDTRQGRVQDSECKANMVVARVKAEAIESLYDQLETQEIYRIAATRDPSGNAISSSSSLVSRWVPWLGEGVNMPSPNYAILCCHLPYRVAPVFVQVVSPPRGWFP